MYSILDTQLKNIVINNNAKRVLCHTVTFMKEGESIREGSETNKCSNVCIIYQSIKNSVQ